MTLLCKYCNREFTPINNKHIFCSDRCRRKNWEKNNPKKAKASVLKSRIKNKDKTRQHNIDTKLNNLEYYLWRNAKYRAKKQNLPFNIEVSDIKIPLICPILKIPLKPKTGTKKGGAYNNSPSLDRIFPRKGYIKGNVRVISFRANVLKNNASYEELEAVLKDLLDVNYAAGF